MGEEPVAVADANVLLNLATPTIDGRDDAPTGADPLKAFITSYDIHVPTSVLGECGDAVGSDDLLSDAAERVLRAADHLQVHDITGHVDDPLDYGLDIGESECIWLANDLHAELFVTDEINTTNVLLVNLAIYDRNVVYSTAHVLCKLAQRDILSPEYVHTALTYYIKTKSWDETYLKYLRLKYLTD